MTRAPQPLFPYPPLTAEGYDTFLPAQPQPVGSLLDASEYKQNANAPKLFQELSIRGVTFPNRAWVAPMCQYSADDGHVTDHHLVHLGAMALRGWGSIMVEATAVLPEARISPEDVGIWKDSHIQGLKRIVDYVHANKGVIGIQLGHAGRKASVPAPWNLRLGAEKGHKGGSVAKEEHGGWPNKVFGPSPISFNEGKFPSPIEASIEYLESVKQAFSDAVDRCTAIGFDFIEVHGAHGYFIHEFVDTISNKRTDKYGGSLENRLRLPLEIVDIVRAKWDKPLFYRFSATDWLEDVLGPEKGKDGEWAWWGIEQTTVLAKKLVEAGVDLLDVSSGGNDLRQKLKIGPSYQLPFAEYLKKAVPNVLIGTVGLITEPQQASDILEENRADVVLLARQVLREVDWPLRAALELGVAVSPAVQYERAWSGLVAKSDALEHIEKKVGATEVQGQEGEKKNVSHGQQSIP